MSPLLDGKVAVVTGASSLIGLATARAMIAEGASVVLGDIKAAIGGEAGVELGERARFVETDVTDDQALAKLVAEASEAFGRLDIAVHVAATFIDDQLETARDRWHEAFDVNLIAAARLIDIAAAAMLPGGSVVLISSVSGKASQPNRLVYPVTKAALLGLSRNAAQLLAPRQIRVNAVSPGWVWSRNIEDRYGSRERADRLGAEFHALGRMADPEEVADAVVFLASEKATFITGADLAVDGGYSAMGPEAIGQAFEKVPIRERS